ncbi:YbaB/EbfC family nucleoid-associated protein [Buchnera aphidicola]|uniref:Nucleoid-associated protein BUCISPPS3390_313 n=1 Tax=Buchnera aphidicola (Cinara cf. splendens/pseudotsugae 3390) TaxID=2518980 RepID=A0A451CXM7_9GAMM|nr:YbaB/EbfC family nucleoid-associated protein [Buchnera aphidicola]VFP77884.1 Nucleoid-associated protein YbaB [Buchnera aphidicola (Cinara cf. splendens/pseudotsugae 3390)]
MFTNEKISEILKQAKNMQKKIEKIQKDINMSNVTGKSGIDLVSVIMNGNYACKSVIISDELWNEKNKTLLQDLITSAINDAVKKIKKIQQRKLLLNSEFINPNNKSNK